ncbi:hypothetical protein BpHYR1_004511 [Brachionus plicatilis]|uniref:Uncharacterized protein n=1 Tax=Brachionus plicatilis TaxID=10195 RepID=A0A3M7SJ36_BRAPC|nr:hypothetical protein BpHYR1_004511 [Brachionus plicatilis]
MINQRYIFGFHILCLIKSILSLYKCSKIPFLADLFDFPMQNSDYSSSIAIRITTGREQFLYFTQKISENLQISFIFLLENVGSKFIPVTKYSRCCLSQNFIIYNLYEIQVNLIDNLKEWYIPNVLARVT